jgi:proteasome lid subunit RPN8/RPN11
MRLTRNDLCMSGRPSGDDTAPTSRLRLTPAQLAEMVAHCIACVPEEGCGLLLGDEAGTVSSVHPTRNTAASAQVYAVDPGEHLRIDRQAEQAGLAVIGVFHSHTHTDPWPSPTDVRQAPDPAWHYVLVGLRHEVASTRSYRIIDGNIFEEAVVVQGSYNMT